MSHPPKPVETIAVSLSNLPEEARSRALARFQIIRPFLEDGVPLAQLVREQGFRRSPPEEVARRQDEWRRNFRVSGREAPYKMTAAKLRLAMASMGQKETKVGELCAELGITRQTLYRHVSPDGSLRPDGKKLLGSSKPATGKIRSESCD